MTKVTILFDGLMVFHKTDDDPIQYEVGMLRGQPGHILNISIGPDEQNILLTQQEIDRIVRNYNRWSLVAVVRGQNLRQVNPIRHDRWDRTDKTNYEEDFQWILNFSDREFHGPDIPMNPGLLRPIIDLTYGDLKTLDTRYAPYIQYSKGINPSTWTNFGYLPQIFALEITLPQQHDYVALVAGRDYVVFKLEYREGVDYTVAINNFDPLHRYTNGASIPDQPSHLQFYYSLLNVNPHERIEIREIGGSQEKTEHTHNSISSKSDKAQSVLSVPLSGGQPYRCGGVEIEGDAPLG